jgi:coenzyme F420 biosynthesis associated uncharacterized protein
VTALVGPPAPPEPVDWARAELLAVRWAGPDLLHRSYAGDALRDDVEELALRARPRVEELTGLPVPSEPSLEMLERGEWCRRNIRLARRLLEPLTVRLGPRLAARPLAPLGRRVAAGELGVVLAYASRRVLGQYDPWVGEPGHIYVIAANIIGAEHRLGVAPRAFRAWVVAHELTHLAQFSGVSWLRGHLHALVSRVAEALDLDAAAVVAAGVRALEHLRARRALPAGGPLALVVREEQRRVIEEIQALMSLLEGHGNFVMRRVGTIVAPGSERIGPALAARRSVGGLEGLVARALGFEMKARQYSVGERFCDAVARAGGPDLLHGLWEAPACLPTQAELEHPERWVRRCGVRPPAPDGTPRGPG